MIIPGLPGQDVKKPLQYRRGITHLRFKAQTDYSLMETTQICMVSAGNNPS